MTSSFFAPPLAIGLMRRNNPSLVPNTRSMPPLALTLDFHSAAVRVTPRRGTISPSSDSAAGAMATNSPGWKHASMSLTNPSSTAVGNAIVDRSFLTGAGVTRRGAGGGAAGNGPDPAPSGSLDVRAYAERIVWRASASVNPSAKARARSWHSVSSSGWPASRN